MSASMIDQPAKVRKGEELDVDRLQAYLNEHLPDQAGKLHVAQFPSGFSNLTYLLELGEHQLVLRRPPFGANIKSAHDMGREYRVLSHLVEVYPKVPRPFLYCKDESVIGAPFYVMERVQGIVLRTEPPAGITLSPEIMLGLSKSFVDTFVQLHQLDFEAAGLADLGQPAGYVVRQVSGWRKRYENARTDEIAELNQVVEWLSKNMPPESGAALIHNDFKYDNLVLDQSDLTRVVAVLDWEMATLGDPLMDLGTSLGYWSEPGDPEALAMFGLTRLPGNLDRQQIVDRYVEKSGRDIRNAVFYYVFGLFKIAVIVQQIYARFKGGHTHDERFAHLIQVVRACARMASLALDKGRIHHLV
ncbi:MAG: phosphotransferase family protein [bacterium]